MKRAQPILPEYPALKTGRFRDKILYNSGLNQYARVTEAGFVAITPITMKFHHILIKNHTFYKCFTEI
jgi:hypothetical protein